MCHFVFITFMFLVHFAATNPRSWRGDCATFPIILPTIFTAMFVALSLRKTNCSSLSSSALIFCCKYWPLRGFFVWWSSWQKSLQPHSVAWRLRVFCLICCHVAAVLCEVLSFLFFFPFNLMSFVCSLHNMPCVWCELTILFLWHWLSYHLLAC